jgi:hypothetical protein
MIIYLAINNTTGYLEQMFSNKEAALDWATAKTANTGDTYTIEEEEAC